jgi:uncharacterized protein (TIGR00369 family)
LPQDQSTGANVAAVSEATLLPGPDPAGFDLLSPEQATRWSRYGAGDDPLFIRHVGMEIVEIRTDYCRLVVPWSPQLMQAGGAIHGGVLASVLDTTCVPALGSGFDKAQPFATIDMHIQYVGAGRENDDLVAVGWVTKRGRSVAFCSAEVASAAGKTLATARLTFSY